MERHVLLKMNKESHMRNLGKNRIQNIFVFSLLYDRLPSSHLVNCIKIIAFNESLDGSSLRLPLNSIRNYYKPVHLLRGHI